MFEKYDCIVFPSLFLSILNKIHKRLQLDNKKYISNRTIVYLCREWNLLFFHLISQFNQKFIEIKMECTSVLWVVTSLYLRWIQKKAYRSTAATTTFMAQHITCYWEISYFPSISQLFGRSGFFPSKIRMSCSWRVCPIFLKYP